MPAATTKSDLCATTEKGWRKLSRLLTAFDAESAMQADADGISAIRIVGHRAAWIEFYFTWCKAAAAKVAPVMPAPGFKWNQLEALNARIFDGQQGWTWEEAVTTLEAAHARLMDDLEGATEGALYGAPLSPELKWTRGRYAEAAGASHYRSAAKTLRKRLRQMADTGAV